MTLLDDRESGARLVACERGHLFYCVGEVEYPDCPVCAKKEADLLERCGVSVGQLAADCEEPECLPFAGWDWRRVAVLTVLALGSAWAVVREIQAMGFDPFRLPF